MKGIKTQSKHEHLRDLETKLTTHRLAYLGHGRAEPADVDHVTLLSPWGLGTLSLRLWKNTTADSHYRIHVFKGKCENG